MAHFKNPKALESCQAGNCVKCNGVIPSMQETHENVFFFEDGGVYHVCDACLNLKNKHTQPYEIEAHFSTSLEDMQKGELPIPEPVPDKKKSKKKEEGDD